MRPSQMYAWLYSAIGTFAGVRSPTVVTLLKFITASLNRSPATVDTHSGNSLCLSRVLSVLSQLIVFKFFCCITFSQYMSFCAKLCACACCSFVCSELWHDPVQCKVLKLWIKKCDDDSETSNWLAANTKATTLTCVT